VHFGRGLVDGDRPHCGVGVDRSLMAVFHGNCESVSADSVKEHMLRKTHRKTRNGPYLKLQFYRLRRCLVVEMGAQSRKREAGGRG
jgi:hypothetical protein